MKEEEVRTMEEIIEGTPEKKEDKLEKKKPSVFYICFIAASIIVAVFVVWLSLTQNEVNISDLWSGEYAINIWYIVLGAVVFLYVAVFLEAARIQIITYRIRKKMEPALCIKAAMLGRCYDLLTPLLTGGKPYQIAYYHSRGFSGGDATSVALSELLAMKLGFAISSILVLAFLGGYLSAFSSDTLFMGMIISGIGVALLLSAITLFISLNKRVTVWIATGIISFAAKIKLVKNKEAALEKTKNTLGNYRAAFKGLVSRPFSVIGVVLLTMCVYVSYAMLVLFVHAAFFGFDISLFPIILLAVVVFDSIMGVVPLPGGTGGVELAFFTMFTVVFDVGLVGVAFLIWKMITYILPIFNGLMVALYDALWGNKKRNRNVPS